ncbi:MAG TPA: 50S ribosomal protein L11 methyltransferase [Polyangiales bacterium]|nr:50S ribosomal protein L11 methyltransferase [Polyangiales bacterium]
MDTPRYPYVHVPVDTEEVEEVSYLLWELGALGVEERDATTLNKPTEGGVLLVASFADDAAAQSAIAELGRSGASLEHVIGDEWRDAYKKYFKVTPLGARLVIRPSWEPYQAKPHEVVVTVDPGRAFGTGTHESTRLVMQALDKHVRGGERVLDVGCGTGILAICALALGAKDALCIDVDPDAVAVTLENAAFNDVSGRVVADVTPVEDVTDTYPLVLANIQATVLVPLAAPIAARVAPAGLLFLSGILIGQEDEVRAAYPDFTLLASPKEGEWIALLLQRS